MKTTKIIPKLIGLGILLSHFYFQLQIYSATLRVWSGGAVMSNAWTNGPNWSSNIAPVPGDDLQFPFDASKSNSSDNYTNGTPFNSIQFWHGGNSTPNRTYDLGGNSIAINAGVSAVNSYPSIWPNSVNNAFLLNSNQSFSTGPYTTLSFSGPINMNGKTLTFDTAASAPIDVRAVISGAGDLIKTNPGTLTLWSNNTYVGSTVINGGTLALGVHGAVTNSTNIVVADATAILSVGFGFSLNAGQTLGGIGTVSGYVNVGVGGGLSPGANGVGTLTCDNSVTLNSGATLHVNLNGTNIGTGYSQLKVNGNVALLNPTLALTLGYVPALGDRFVIITNAGSSFVSGTFNGLPEGTFFTNSGMSFNISYAGGDGNDVVLTRTNLPVQGPSILVTTTADSGAGSLREALAAATNNNTILFATNVTGAIKLTTGELIVNQNLSVLGPGPVILAVDGNAAGRVFHISNGVAAFISGLTITNGAVSGSSDGHVGGGIWNDHATLTLSNCTVIFNNAGNGPGGGIFNDGTSGSATLSIIASALSQNYALSNAAGGIYNYGYGGNATVSITASTFDRNSAGGSSGAGAGIFNESGTGSATVTVTNSTFNFNIAGQYGGGIYNVGGILGGTGIVTVVACTFSGNIAQGGVGACLYNTGTAGTLQIGDTILSGGTVVQNVNLYNQNGTAISLGYNLSSDNSGSLILTNATDQNKIDPKLGLFADFGGPTFTRSLLWGSPAIDRGKAFGLTTDQRGIARPHDLSSITNAPGGDGTDIGAFEFVPPPAEFTSIAALGNASQIQGSGLSNLSYSIQAATNLNAPINWTNIGVAPANATGIFSFTDTNAPLYPTRFYRAISP
jgi:autotransporter-associated beta strand protein